MSPPEPTCCPTLSPAHFRVAQIFFDSSYDNSLRSTNSVLSPPVFRVSPPEPTTYARINFVAGPLKRVSPAHFLFAQIFVDSSYDNSLRYTNYLLSPPAFRLSPPSTELELVYPPLYKLQDWTEISHRHRREEFTFSLFLEVESPWCGVTSVFATNNKVSDFHDILVLHLNQSLRHVARFHSMSKLEKEDIMNLQTLTMDDLTN